MFKNNLFSRTGLISLLSLAFLIYFVFHEMSFGQEKQKLNIIAFEDSLVALINKYGVGKRFLIKEIMPNKKELASRVTIKPLSSFSEGRNASIVDIIADDEGRLGGYIVKGPSVGLSFTIDTDFREDKYYILMSSGGGISGVYIMGNGSIHRFEGKVKFYNYTIINEGGKFNHLTFVLTGKGYVHLCGKGKVILPNGKEILLGY